MFTHIKKYWNRRRMREFQESIIQDRFEEIEDALDPEPWDREMESFSVNRDSPTILRRDLDALAQALGYSFHTKPVIPEHRVAIKSNDK